MAGTVTASGAVVTVPSVAVAKLVKLPASRSAWVIGTDVPVQVIEAFGASPAPGNGQTAAGEIFASVIEIWFVIVTFPEFKITKLYLRISPTAANEVVVGSTCLSIVRDGVCVIVVVAGADVTGFVCSVSNVAVFDNVPPASISACVTLYVAV